MENKKLKNEKKEDVWTQTICDRLKNALDNKYEVVCKENVPYSISLNNYYYEDKININKSTFQVDLLIKEKKENRFIPRLIIESKYGKITTHDTMTYNNKAKKHKNLISGLRYGLMIGNAEETCIPPRVFKLGDEFDFMFKFEEYEPSDEEWELFVNVIKRNLDISTKLEQIIEDSNTVNKHRYFYINRNIEFYSDDED